jgi:Flp pilus assembly protein CpaB
MSVIGTVRTPNAANIRTPLFILGVGLALVAFLVMFGFGLLFANRTGAGAQIHVLVAARDINAREPLTGDAVKVVSWPQSGAPPKVLGAASQATGTTALVDIPVGQPITANMVSVNPDVTTHDSYLPIPAGYEAITIPTSEGAGVGGYIAEGDYINVIATVNTQLFDPNVKRPISVDKRVFREVYVLRVGPQSSVRGQGQAEGVASTLTVLLTGCDALYMNWFKTNAQLTYLLVSYRDYGQGNTTADQSCPLTASAGVGPAQVNARWEFTKV